MADITVTAAQVAPCDPEKAEILNCVAAVAITQGQAVYMLTTGLVGVCDANDSGKEQFLGIALNAAGIGQPVAVLVHGAVSGFAVTGNAGSLLYASNTAGALADSAGAMTVKAGMVVVISDQNTATTGTKVAFIYSNWLNGTVWS